MLIYIFINKADYTSGFSQKKFNLKFACCAFYFIKNLVHGASVSDLFYRFNGIENNSTSNIGSPLHHNLQN